MFHSLAYKILCFTVWLTKFRVSQFVLQNTILRLTKSFVFDKFQHKTLTKDMSNAHLNIPKKCGLVNFLDGVRSETTDHPSSRARTVTLSLYG